MSVIIHNGFFGRIDTLAKGNWFTWKKSFSWGSFACNARAKRGPFKWVDRPQIDCMRSSWAVMRRLAPIRPHMPQNGVKRKKAKSHVNSHDGRPRPRSTCTEHNYVYLYSFARHKLLALDDLSQNVTFHSRFIFVSTLPTTI